MFEEFKECTYCGTLKASNTTPEGDEVCPSCGDREMMDYEGEKELVSNCCSAPVNEDYMICPACQEHCDVVETE